MLTTPAPPSRSIIGRQGSSRDRWLKRDWRRNRETACFRWRSSRIYLFQFGRKSKAARRRNKRSEWQPTPAQTAPRAMSVNHRQPGPTATDMGGAHAELAKALVPLGRMADVSEIAGFVSYLASNEAGFITGASLTIDGGYIA